MIRWRIRVLSPVHIGSGEVLDGSELLRFEDRLGVLDAKGAMQELLGRAQGAGDRAKIVALFRNERSSLAEALSRFDVPPEEALAGPAVRYVLDLGEGFAENALANRVTIHEATKRAGRQPYIPGTSVKGVVRTSILWNLVRRSVAGTAPPGYEDLAARATSYLRFVLSARRLVRDLTRQRGQTPRNLPELVAWLESPAFARRYGYRIVSRHSGLISDLLRLDKIRTGSFEEHLLRALDDFASWGPSRIGADLATFVFGPTPSEDALRALVVTDSFEETATRWSLYPTRVFATDSPVGRIIDKSVVPEYFECLPPGMEAVVEVGSILEEEVYNSRIRRLWIETNRWGERRFLLTDLAAACRERSRRQVEIEYERAKAAFPATPYFDFHRELFARSKADGDPFLVRMGGRNGWDMNTVTSLLEPDIVESLRSRFRLGNMEREVDKNGREFLKPFGIFPKTKQIVVDGETPMMPMGWVEVRPER